MIPTAFLPLSEFIRGWESCRLIPYRDSANLWTVGIGHLLTLGCDPVPISQETADELFEQDLMQKVTKVERLILEEIEQHELDACVDFAFNLGLSAFAGSTLLKRLNAGYKDQAADQFLVWDKEHVNGVLQVSNGLHKRRVAERNLFLNADYTGRP